MKFFLTLLSSVVIASSTRAAFFTNNVSVDAFVRSNTPIANYGGAGSLSVSGLTATNVSGLATNGIEDTFIRFNTAAMVTNLDFAFGTNNWVINGAKLRVTEIGAPAQTIFNRGKGAFEIRWIANTNWAEGTGMPNSPGSTGIVFTNELILLNAGTDVSLGTFTNAGVDFTNNFTLALPAVFTSSMKAGGEVGFFLTAIDSSIGFTFNSRSFGTVSARPYLEISAVPRPGIAAISLSGTDVILSATNGVVGGAYYVLGSTNFLLPLNQWTPVAFNVPVANGNFTLTVTNGVNSNAPQQFFILQTQ
jgi:hypothetical protein